ncbi:MAG: dTDP-4-dehydrorhamnose reductase [Actinobacteria bacterium]|nr:MAG: dTDP-4-dehydrorhamnose reductase [Actinomycetota bacterium]
MKVLITGAKGQLGQDLQKVFADEEVAAYDLDLDITDLSPLLKKFESFKPDTIIHAAAYTDVDGCEKNQDTAFEVNALGTANVAIAANYVDAQMLYVSTDYIFDGESDKPRTEFDNVNPQSVYGKSKLAGEKAVSSLTNKFYIARTAWLYGHGGANFVKTILRAAKEKGKLKVVDDQRGSPTFSLDLAEKIKEIVKSGQYGTYHVTNSGECSWFDFAKKIVELGGINAQITPCSTKEYPRPAKRPAFSVLRNYNLELRGFKPMRSWQDALESYFEGSQ